MTPRRPQICPICGEPGDGVAWCEKCREAYRKEDALNGAENIEWAAKRGRNFERLRNHKKAVLG